MFIKNILLTSVLLLACSLRISGAAYAQNYDAMIQQQLQQGQLMQQQMHQMQNGIVQQNMQNPQVQQMYQQHIASGGRMSFQQFAYSYAATGGFTQQGMNNFQQSERGIQQRDQAALDAYRQNQANIQAGMQQNFDRQNQIAHQRGNLLNGTTDYYDPSTGQRYNLPHTAQGGDTFYNPNSNQAFQRDGLGNYQRFDPNGYAYDLEEEE